MWKLCIALAVVLAGLVALDLRLASEDAFVRRTSSKVRQLIPPEKRESKMVAALRLEDSDRDETLIYTHMKDGWRCPSRFNAPADASKIGGLVDKIFTAQGIVQSRERSRAGAFGLGHGHTLILHLGGPGALVKPDGDRIASVEIGASAPDENACYVRLPGKEEIWKINADLREDLAPPAEAPALHPLVDPHVVPGGWPAGGGVVRVRIEREDGERLELMRREKKLAPDELKTQLPYDWVLLREGKEEVCPPGPSNAYSAFLHRASFTAILDPKTLPQLGLDRPAAKILLTPGSGDGMEIVVGKKGTRGAVPVKNGLTGNAVEVTEDTARLLAPPAKDLLSTEAQTAWDAALKRDQPQFPPGMGAPGLPAGLPGTRAAGPGSPAVLPGTVPPGTGAGKK